MRVDEDEALTLLGGGFASWLRGWVFARRHRTDDIVRHATLRKVGGWVGLKSV